MAAYSAEEIKQYDKWTRRTHDEARSENRKKSYDPKKRALLYQQDKAKILEKRTKEYDPKKRALLYQQNKSKILAKKAKIYQDNIGKFKEKPKDRASLKGRAFVTIYNKA